MSELILLALLVTLTGSLVLAAVPPLSEERLQADSSLIVTGRISKVTTTTRDVGNGRDTIYHVEIEVVAVEKGDAECGQTIKAQTWEPDRRPDGWVGPQGQNVTPKAGLSVRCYLRGSSQEGYHFLVPNGLELLKPAPPASQRQ
jgi:hypothetical protein